MFDRGKPTCGEFRISDDIVITVCSKKGSTIQLGLHPLETERQQSEANDSVTVRMPSMTMDDFSGE